MSGDGRDMGKVATGMNVEVGIKSEKMVGG